MDLAFKIVTCTKSYYVDCTTTFASSMAFDVIVKIINVKIVNVKIINVKIINVKIINVKII